jgi:hypothetical protein
VKLSDVAMRFILAENIKALLYGHLQLRQVDTEQKGM